MAALRCRFRSSARQTHRKITGAERVTRRGGINHFLFRQLHRRHVNNRFPGNRHQAGVCPALNHDFRYTSSLSTGDHLINRLFAPQGIFVIEG